MRYLLGFILGAVVISVTGFIIFVVGVVVTKLFRLDQSVPPFLAGMAALLIIGFAITLCIVIGELIILYFEEDK